MRRLVLLLAIAVVPAAACQNASTSAQQQAQPAQTAGNRLDRPAAVPIGTAGAADQTGSAPATARETTADADVRAITIPAGTRLPITLDSTVGSDISRAEQPVEAHLTRPVRLEGTLVLPEGSRVTGVVTSAVRSGRVKGRAHVAIRFETIAPRGQDERYRIDAAPVGRTAPATKKKDALEIGAPAAGGALIGALIGGKKGALIGTAAGGGAGTAVVLSTRGREVRLAKGAALTLRLTRPVTVHVRR